MLFKIAALEIFMTPSLLRNLQFPSLYFMGFPGGSEVKASASSAGNPGSIPGLEDPLEKEMATHSSILA